MKYPGPYFIERNVYYSLKIKIFFLFLYVLILFNVIWHLFFCLCVNFILPLEPNYWQLMIYKFGRQKSSEMEGRWDLPEENPLIYANNICQFY